MSKYVIVRRDFEVPTEAYYADSLEQAVERRYDLVTETGHDWRIFENAEELIKNRFFRWLTVYTERLAD